MLWLVVLSVVVQGILGQDYRYVMPENCSDCICPDQPCRTLGQFIEMSEMYFTNGSTFVFLSGNHSLESVLRITDASNITLRRAGYSATARVFLGSRAIVVCHKIDNLHIEGITFILCKNHCIPSAIQILYSQVVISDSIFQGSGDGIGDAVNSLQCYQSNLLVVNCIFEDNTGLDGGAIECRNESSLTIVGSTFVRNRARNGGALRVVDSIVLLKGDPENAFQHNVAISNSGALLCVNCTLTLTGRNSFNNNTCVDDSCYGGAVSVLDGDIAFRSSTVLFSRNEAFEGGAIEVYESVLFCDSASTVVLDKNRAWYGGALSVIFSSVQTKWCSMTITNNFAEEQGGGIDVGSSRMASNKEIELTASFRNNSANDCGGAVVVRNENNVKLRYVNMTRNFQGALCVIDSRVTFSMTRWMDNKVFELGGGIASENSILRFSDYNLFEGNAAGSGGALSLVGGTASFEGATAFLNNTAQRFGGAVYSEELVGKKISDSSILRFGDYNLFEGNTARSGGALSLAQGTASFEGTAVFVNNTAHMFGGAVYTEGTVFNIQQPVQFIYNWARFGGALHLSEASITMRENGRFNFSLNRASKYGGAIHHQDIPSPNQCFNEPGHVLPNCFIQIEADISKGVLFSNNDTAGIGGNFLYGGLLDRCQLNINPLKEGINILSLLIDGYNDSNHSLASSKPYALCLCVGVNDTPNCTTNLGFLKIHRGLEIGVPLVAIAQGNTFISTSVTATVSSTANLKISQSTQQLPPYCSYLNYSLFSTNEYEEIVLYPEGPCYDSGYAGLTLHFTLLPCPDGFILNSNGHCTCEERLHEYNVTCTIDEDIQLTKKAGSGLWIGAEYNNGTYEGLILSKTCPAEYCRLGEVNMTLSDVDVQCVEGRTGLLCGGCSADYSLAMGSSECKKCSNAYLFLILPFAAAGIGLVIFLTILRLTVATGMINSILLYANIVQANRKLFFLTKETNILTVFIAWMNLDLGFDVCFYHRMDAFAETCLQFAFPLYVWVLISAMILTSRYSIRVSKLIGHNPVAVLATLILMSYNKILKIIIEVYSSVKLDYPGNRTEPVWLKDANVPLLKSRHLALTVVTSMILVCVFIPYTLLLLFGHKFYRFTGQKYLHWFIKIKPFLDPYHAPYKTRTSYWTGFMLLLRCILYVVFSFNSLEGTDRSLLSIVITFSAVGFTVGFIYQGKIYRSSGVNILEASVYLNLITIAALALAKTAHLAGFVYFLVGIVFATFLGIIAYHFHILYTRKLALWSKFKARLFHNSTSKDEPTVTDMKSTSPSLQPVSKTFIDLREPLLEN